MTSSAPEGQRRTRVPQVADIRVTDRIPTRRVLPATAGPATKAGFVRAAEAGFTMVELVAVLVVIGIFAAFAIPRFTGRIGFESRGFYDHAQSLVRYAQKVAVARRHSPPKGPLFLSITTSQIRACLDASCATLLTDPSTGSPMMLTAPAGVTLSPPTTFSFDGSGAPSFDSVLAIQVKSSGVGDVNRVFYVQAKSGYVHK